MSDDNTGLPAEEHSGLDKLLDEAIGAEPVVEATDDATSSKPGRARDPETGQFKAGEASSKEQAQPAAETPPSDAVDPAQAALAQQQQPTQHVEAPARWTDAEKAKFAQWPPEIQEVVADHVRQADAAFTRMSQQAAEYRRATEPIWNAIAPYQQYLAEVGPQLGATTGDLIRNLLQTEYQLRTASPQHKYQTAAWVLQQYGIDLAALASGQVPGTDPASLQQRQHYDQLQQRLNELEGFIANQQDQQLQNFIDSFEQETDSNGQRRYPLFKSVKPQIAQLFMQAADEGRSMSMEEAYKMAVEPFQAHLASTLQSQTQVADQQRQAAVDKAARAQGARSSTGSQPGGGVGPKGLDAHLDAALTAGGIG